MTRSALVLCTPKNCYWCPFSCADGNDTDCGYCELNGCLTDAEVLIEEEYFDLESETKPDWCPLKPLPEKKEYINSVSNIEATKNIAAAGWNACLDEITGEVK